MRTILLLSLLLTARLHGQNAIEAFPGTPTLDGMVDPGEWDMAPSVAIGTAPGDTCRVAVMTDFAAVYFAFMGYLESSNVLFPEVLLDTQHDRTPAWNADDQWFHVSATDCHHQGDYGVYDDCLLVQPDWTGVPNLTPGAPITDTVELAIPWSKLGLAPVEGDSIGLCLLVTNTASSWRLWPNSASRLAPDTWGHLVVPFWNSVAEVQASELLRAWPSPADQELHLVPASGAQANGRMRLFDLQGRVVVDRQLAFPAVLPTHDLQAATYVCIVTMADGRQLTRRVSIVH